MTNIDLFFDRKGNPIDVLEWSEQYKDFESRRIGYEKTAGGTYLISTIFAGLDLTPPSKEIYETIIFNKKTGAIEAIERYKTEEDANEGHKEFVKFWTAFEKASQENKNDD